jgi:hypothetical protein
MPSRPLSADRHAITQLHTRDDVEAIAITKGRDRPRRRGSPPGHAGPPTRVDLVDEVMYRIGTRKADRNDWPPYALVCGLATKVKATHLGEVRLRGPNGETVGDRQTTSAHAALRAGRALMPPIVRGSGGRA